MCVVEMFCCEGVSDGEREEEGPVDSPSSPPLFQSRMTCLLMSSLRLSGRLGQSLWLWRVCRTPSLLQTPPDFPPQVSSRPRACPSLPIWSLLECSFPLQRARSRVVNLSNRTQRNCQIYPRTNQVGARRVTRKQRTKRSEKEQNDWNCTVLPEG